MSTTNVALAISVALNLILFLRQRTPAPASAPGAAQAATGIARRLQAVADDRRLQAVADDRRLQAVADDEMMPMRDCASVACPLRYSPQPRVQTGHSVYKPFFADTRFRPTPPRNMLELTRLIYGADSRLAEPYIGYDNPFGKTPDASYEWTQINEKYLDQAWELIGGRAQMFIEVGSFVGRSSILIANWLRRHDAENDVVRAGSARGRGGRRQQPPPAVAGGEGIPLLCIDTWVGDLGMVLGTIYKSKMDRRHGMPTLYHTWLLNVIASNNTERILPLVAPSLLGSRVLEHLRLAADVIYLDSAHELQETFTELVAYWPLIRPGGLLMGDDFNWQAVSHDVQLFARTHNLTVESFDGCHARLRDTPRTESVAVTCVWFFHKSWREFRRGVMPRRGGLWRG